MTPAVESLQAVLFDNSNTAQSLGAVILSTTNTKFASLLRVKGKSRRHISEVLTSVSLTKLTIKQMSNPDCCSRLIQCLKMIDWANKKTITQSRDKKALSRYMILSVDTSFGGYFRDWHYKFWVLWPQVVLILKKIPLSLWVNFYGNCAPRVLTELAHLVLSL